MMCSPAAAQGFFKKKEVPAPAAAASTPAAPVAEPTPPVAVVPAPPAVAPAKLASSVSRPSPIPAAVKVEPVQPAQTATKTLPKIDRPSFPPMPPAAPMPIPVPQQAKVQKAPNPARAASASVNAGKLNRQSARGPSSSPLGVQPAAPVTQSPALVTQPKAPVAPPAQTLMGSCAGMESIAKGVCLSIQCLKPQFSSATECLKLDRERKARDSANESLRS